MELDQAFLIRTSDTNSTVLGFLTAAGGSNTVRIGNTAITSIGGVIIWSMTSVRRFKPDIKEDVFGLEFITRLHPVTYHFDMDAMAIFYQTPDCLRLPHSERLKAAELQRKLCLQTKFQRRHHRVE